MNAKSTTLRCALIAIGLVVVTIAPAAAQDVPDMVGTWKGIATAVTSGNNPYRPDEKKSGVNFGPNIEYTFVIREQQGVHFTGESTNRMNESLLGGLRPPDYKTGYILDNDGEYAFTLRDPRTMDFCYRHSNLSSRVVSCYTATKQP